MLKKRVGTEGTGLPFISKDEHNMSYWDVTNHYAIKQLFRESLYTMYWILLDLMDEDNTVMIDKRLILEFAEFLDKTEGTIRNVVVDLKARGMIMPTDFRTIYTVVVPEGMHKGNHPNEIQDEQKD